MTCDVLGSRRRTRTTRDERHEHRLDGIALRQLDVAACLGDEADGARIAAAVAADDAAAARVGRPASGVSGLRTGNGRSCASYFSAASTSKLGIGPLVGPPGLNVHWLAIPAISTQNRTRGTSDHTMSRLLCRMRGLSDATPTSIQGRSRNNDSRSHDSRPSSARHTSFWENQQRDPLDTRRPTATDTASTYNVDRDCTRRHCP